MGETNQSSDSYETEQNKKISENLISLLRDATNTQNEKVKNKIQDLMNSLDNYDLEGKKLKLTSEIWKLDSTSDPGGLIRLLKNRNWNNADIKELDDALQYVLKNVFPEEFKKLFP